MEKNIFDESNDLWYELKGDYRYRQRKMALKQKALGGHPLFGCND